MAEYIDRKVAIDWFSPYLHTDESVPPDVILEDVHSLPSADVAPVVHGKWIQCFEDWRMQIEGDKCSICGFEHYGTPRGEFKFCPNCGAKMDGGESK